MRTSEALQIGKAGEYLVCADAIMKGLVAFPSEQGLPYDVLIDNGKRLLRVQVKTTTGPRIVPQRNIDTHCYIFSVKRHGKNNRHQYDDGEVDVFALVCLDTRRVGYLLNEDMPTTINFRVDELRGSYYDEKGISDYAKVVELRSKMTQTEMAKTVGIDISTINRMCQPEYKPFVTNARYFSDIERSPDWFAEL